jgi:tetratricopeptide (TPR) repeat protein
LARLIVLRAHNTGVVLPEVALRRIAALLLAPCLLLCLCASAPSTSPSTDPDVPALILQLNDPDPQLRENATKTLWSRGRLIEPQLRAAAQNGPPEVVRRARSILRDFAFGLYPDTPKDIFNLVAQYRDGDLGQKQTAIWMLNSHGMSGLRVLLRLHEQERAPELKTIYDQVLESRRHDVATLLVADGDLAAVRRMLEDAITNQSPGARIAIQDYAALLSLTGKLPVRVDELKTDPLTPRNAALHLALARATGDLPSAKQAAQKLPEPETLDAVLADQGDWPELARRMDLSIERLEPSERLGYLCAYYRLSGDEPNMRKTAQKLVDLADRSPQDHAFCAENLFLNGLPDEAESVLLSHHDYVAASNYLGSRLEFKKALELPELSRKDQPDKVLEIKAKTVESLHFTGRADQARQLLADTAAENQFRNDRYTWTSLIEAAQQLGDRGLADEYAAAALMRAQQHEPIATIFEKIQLGDGQDASLWWQFLRRQGKTEPPAQTLRRLREIFEGSVKGESLNRLARSAEDFVTELSVVDQDSFRRAVARTFAQSGQTELAEQWYTGLVKTSNNPSILIDAGDSEASRNNWPGAADDYATAYDRDPGNATALYLRGWALSQWGRADEGRRLMETADLLPLGSETARHDLYEAMKRHKLAADSWRELKLILTLTSERSWERNEALRESAEQAATNGDYLAAAGLWERAFLANLGNSVSFVEPWANIVVPALVHKTRALGLIQSGQIDQAMNEARLTMHQVPADADALIELVNAFDKSGHKAEADKLYQDQTAIYRRLTTDYPNSGPAHNQLAWAQVMCHRELDDALKNAKRAVEIEPASTASLDTLAEVYFAGGDARDAAAQMQRCIDLEPHVPRHRQQLEKFKAAVRATTQPSK